MALQVGLYGERTWCESVSLALRGYEIEVGVVLNRSESPVFTVGAAPFRTLLAQGRGDGDDAAVVRAAMSCAPSVPVILVMDTSDLARAREARWAGAAEVVVLPQDYPGLPAIIERVERPGTQRLVSGQTQGNIVVAIAPKGGCGASLVAAGLTQALARQSQETALVDLNLPYGGQEALFGLLPHHTTVDLAALCPDLESQQVDQAAVRQASGVAVICATANRLQSDRLDYEEVQEIIAAAQTRWAWVVVDAPRHELSWLEGLSERARHVLVVTTADPLALRTACLLKRSGILQGARAGIVVNRLSGAAPFSPAEVAERVGVPLWATIPEDPTLHAHAMCGEPLLPANKRRLSAGQRALGGLAARLISDQTVEGKGK